MPLPPFPELLLDRSTWRRLIPLVVGFSFLASIDAILTIWVASRIGGLAAVAGIGLCAAGGASLFAVKIASLRRFLGAEADRGRFESRNIHRYYGLWAAALLMVAPGVFSSLLALCLYPAPLGVLLGKVILGANSASLQRIHEYLHGTDR